MPCIKDRVYGYLNLHPKSTNIGLSKAFPLINISTLRVYKSTFKGSRYESGQVIAQLTWLYELLTKKIIKGLSPSEKDRKRIKVIEQIIGVKK